MRFRKLIILVVPLTLVLWASSASAATGCAGAPAASAINQYCETFPGATGSQSPKAGGSSIGSTLPSRIVRQLVGAGTAGSTVVGTSSGTRAASSRVHRGRHGASARAGLLSVPAASIHRTNGPLRAASTSAWSLYGSLFVGLIVATLALAVATVVIARRRQSSDS